MPKTFTLDDVVRRAAVKSGCTEQEARQVIHAGIRLLHEHADPAALSAFYDVLPGAEAVAVAAVPHRRRPKPWANLIKGPRGVPWPVVMDGAALLLSFKNQGIERVTAKRLARSVRVQIEAETGRDLLGDALRTIPGVGAMLTD